MRSVHYHNLTRGREITDCFHYKLMVNLLDGEHCIHTVEMELGELVGVESVKAHLDGPKVDITFDAPATEEKIKALLAEINYPVAG